MKHRHFPQFDETTAPAGAREPLSRTKRAFGAIPEPLSRYASSPLLLGVALSGLDAFEKGTLSALDREVLAMTMGRRNGCKFCVDFHLRMLAAQNVAPELVQALTAGEPLQDRRLEALRLFIIELLDQHGDVSQKVWSDFRDAGYSHEQALEILTGVSLYTLTTLTNRLTESSE